MAYQGNYDEMNLSAMALSGGTNVVLLDDVGLPSFYVIVPRGKISDVIDGGSQQIHPAFMVNTSEIDRFYFSKYANVVEGDRAYSLPFRDPSVYIGFDRAVTVCENKGIGFHLATNAEWAWLALWCKKNGTVPHGNNFCGCDVNNRHEHGIQSMDWVLGYNWNSMAYKIEADTKRYHHTGRVFTGSGPVTWAHDHTNAGIYGLNGNVWKWIGGLRLMNGEIQIIPYNNAAAHVPQSRNSSHWKAILPNGNLVDPGTAGTLKYDSINAGNTNLVNTNIGAPIINSVVEHPAYTGGSTDDYWAYNYIDGFNALTAKSGVDIPEIMKALCLAPIPGSERHGSFWARNYGERIPIRGGNWSNSVSTGVDALYLNAHRANSSNNLGLFSAYVELQSV